MSRSFGDTIAASIGVTSEPEFTTKHLTTEDRFLVIGSDGLFEYLTNQHIVELIGASIKNRTLSTVADQLCIAARRAWNLAGVKPDDISVIIVLFNYNH